MAELFRASGDLAWAGAHYRRGVFRFVLDVAREVITMLVKGFDLKKCRRLANSWFANEGDSFYVWAKTQNGVIANLADIQDMLGLVGEEERVSCLIHKIGIISDGVNITLRFTIYPEQKDVILARSCYRVKIDCNDFMTRDDFQLDGTPITDEQKESCFGSILLRAYHDLLMLEDKYGLRMMLDTHRMLTSMLAIAVYIGCGLDYEEGEDDADE